MSKKVYVTVDPDVKKSGYALGCLDVHGHRLLTSGLAADDQISSVVGCLESGLSSDVVIELPQVYGKTGNQDPNDLIMLAVVVGEWRAAARGVGAKVTLKTAREWKGSRKKWHMHKQAFSVLTQEERRGIAVRANTSEDKIADYIERACVNHALKRRVAYGWQMGEVLDAVTMNLVLAGRML